MMNGFTIWSNEKGFFCAPVIGMLGISLGYHQFWTWLSFWHHVLHSPTFHIPHTHYLNFMLSLLHFDFKQQIIKCLTWCFNCLFSSKIIQTLNTLIPANKSKSRIFWFEFRFRLPDKYFILYMQHRIYWLR